MKSLLLTSIFTIGLFSLYSCGPDLTKYQYLKEPHITTQSRQKMIIVEIQGDPSVAGKRAFQALFSTFYKLKKGRKDIKMVPPRARWPKSFDTPRNEWLGIYGLPLPENVTTLPVKKKESDPDVRLAYWEYGEVAEILHRGPYSEEYNTIVLLYKFIEENGYKIAGYHEEEYLKGPGWLFKGDPKKYQTIIRYQIEKE